MFKEKISQLKEKAEKAREKFVGPRTIEFANGKTLVVSVIGEEPQIKLMDGNKEIMDLKSLAPAGTKLEFSETYKWSAEPGKVFIGKFTGIDCLLAYLHEAGHLNKTEDVDLIHTARANHFREKIKDKSWSYPLERLRAMKEERKVVIASERDAWAYALWQARKLEKEQGLDIFKRFGRVRDVMDFVNKYLGSYEQGYLDELYDCYIFTKKDMEELFAKLDEWAKEKEAA